MHLVRSVCQTQDAGPREELGQGPVSREAHGSVGLQCGVETVLVGHLVASVDTDLHGSVHHPLCHLGSHYLDHGNLLTGNLGGQQQKQPINLTPQSRYSLIERERERESV